MAPKSSQIAPHNASETADDGLETPSFDGEGAVQTATQTPFQTPFQTDAIRGARRTGTRWRAISRYVGLGIFLFGVFLLGYVFLQALEGFKQFSDMGRLRGQMTLMTGDDWVSTLQGTAAVLGKEVLRVLYLFILGYIASAIAARGIGFFAASEAVIDEAVLPDI